MSFEFRASIPSNTDTTLFAWQRIRRESALPPIVAHVAGKYYLLSGFGRTADGCLLKNLETMRDALLFSISLHVGATLPELAEIAQLADKLKIEISSLPVFEDNGIKGAKNIETLRKTPALPESILKYLGERPLPLKTLALLASFEKDAAKYIADFVDKKHPSVQALKIYIESAADFRAELEACRYDESFTFPDRRTATHKEIDDALKVLSDKAAPVKIVQPDNFETSKLIFSFEATDGERYAEYAKKLENIKDDVAHFYNLLKKHDIY